MKVHLDCVQEAGSKGSPIAALEDRLIVAVTLTALTDLAVGPEAVGGADELVVVEGLNHGNPVLAKDRQDGGRDLVVDEVEVGDGRLSLSDQLPDLPPGLSRVEHPLRDAWIVPKTPAIEELDPAHEVLRISSRVVLRMFHGKGDDLMAVRTLQLAEFEEVPVGPSAEVKELVDV